LISFAQSAIGRTFQFLHLFYRASFFCNSVINPF